jgi:hypothetical protein
VDIREKAKAYRDEHGCSLMEAVRKVCANEDRERHERQVCALERIANALERLAADGIGTWPVPL